jgi:hypothetical protein
MGRCHGLSPSMLGRHMPLRRVRTSTQVAVPKRLRMVSSGSICANLRNLWMENEFVHRWHRFAQIEPDDEALR